MRQRLIWTVIRRAAIASAISTAAVPVVLDQVSTVATVAAAPDMTPWVLPSMPGGCSSAQSKSGDVAGCLLNGSNGSPGQRGFGEPPFPWPAPGAAIPWVDLRQGAASHVVHALQGALLGLGWTPPQDGDFGSLTTTAVKGFQKQTGLPSTGIVDQATASALGISNTEPGAFPPPGFRFAGWGYNGSPALAAWEAALTSNTRRLGALVPGRLQGNPDALGLFEGFVEEVQAGGYSVSDAGMYVFRCTSNSLKSCQGLTPSSLSNHSWGLAMDLNVNANPEITYVSPADGSTACAVPQRTNVPKWVVEVAQKWGLYWGGYGWSGGGCKTPESSKSVMIRDPMHFEFRGDVTQAQAILLRNTGTSTPGRLCMQTAGDDGLLRRSCADSRLPSAGWRLPIDVGAPKGATAALVNIAVTDGAAPGFVTAESCAAVTNPVRQWANGNFPAATTVSNLSVVPLDAKGLFCLYASQRVQTIVDVQGFFVRSSQKGSAGFVPIPQERVLDTRTGSSGPLPGGATSVIPTLGAVPAGATAVLVNAAITDAVGPGFATVDRCSELTAGPTSANINFAQTSAIANLAVIAQPDGYVAGSSCLWPMVAAQAVIDTQGAFVPGQGLGFSLVGPQRLVDTRGCAFHDGIDQCGAAVGAGQMVRVTGARGTAALVNLALTESTADLFAVADTCDVLTENRPLRSNANTTAGRTVSNLAVVPVAADGSFCVWVSAPTHVVVDIQGVFEASGTLRFVVQDPTRKHDTREM